MKSKDVVVLDNWLRSPETGIEMYAVEGFYRLKQKGFKLSDEQLKIINFIKNKNAIVWICDDAPDPVSVREVAAQFVF